MLAAAERGGYGVGSFSPRYTPMVLPVLRAGQKMRSPLIVQISNNELKRYFISAGEFAEEFYRVVRDEQITVPVVLHLEGDGGDTRGHRRRVHLRDDGRLREAPR
jgi:fructose-bisphosphate aldolase class II